MMEDVQYLAGKAVPNPETEATMAKGNNSQRNDKKKKKKAATTPKPTTPRK
ncbi:MAG TPA: hypothetical protein PLX97_01565 [Gemmatales bacterium]|nr:hypothetical protein [Gemmatales bacterium]